MSGVVAVIWRQAGTRSSLTNYDDKPFAVICQPRDIRDIAKKYGLKDAIQLLGWIKPSTIGGYLRSELTLNQTDSRLPEWDRQDLVCCQGRKYPLSRQLQKHAVALSHREGSNKNDRQHCCCWSFFMIFHCLLNDSSSFAWCLNPGPLGLLEKP